jgi:hypothetical protein
MSLIAMNSLPRPVCRRKVLLAALVFLAFSLPLGARSQADETEARGGSKILLVVDYGDGVQKHILLPWREKMTVFAALEDASEHPRGIKFKHRGKAETVFITAIDDCENEGSGRNWTYRVNDKGATQSCGIASLADGDSVLWKFSASR